jgi:Methyltransferase domain
MSSSLIEIQAKILEVQPDLHGAGTVSADALRAIAKHASERTIRHSAETGCGATTLMLSHLSRNHTVFAIDIGGSVANVRRSPLLRQGVVSFTEGPSQLTLPQHHFAEGLQLALIDGPHAYPFPDLEYYFLYPHLDSGALLILDDIQIRSIHNLFEFLRDDAMFRLDEVVRTTAFFTRTAAPTFDPFGDGWRNQKYNGHTLLRYDWRSKLIGVLPRSLVRRLAVHRHPQAHAQSRCSIEILSPHTAQRVAEIGIVKGRANVPDGAYLWVLVHRTDIDGWWPQGDGPVPVAAEFWTVPVHYGGPEDVGFRFEVAAVIVTRTVHERWLEWVQAVKDTGEFPPVKLPMPPAVLAETYRTVQKESPPK